MRVLIGFEESQAVCKAFRERGHEAYSCDLQQCSGNLPQYHLWGDIYDYIYDEWDLIGLHPECTKVAVCGNKTYGAGKEKHPERLHAISYIQGIWEVAKEESKYTYLENPVGVLTRVLGNPQYIQPYQFGHPEQKKTGLWLHNLPELIETNNVKEEMDKLPKHKAQKVFYMSPGPERAKNRSKTFSGIANAMAEQWSELLW